MYYDMSVLYFCCGSGCYEGRGGRHAEIPWRDKVGVQNDVDGIDVVPTGFVRLDRGGRMLFF